jgi:hypothetical protein
MFRFVIKRFSDTKIAMGIGSRKRESFKSYGESKLEKTK